MASNPLVESPRDCVHHLARTRPMPASRPALRIAVVGAGPIGLTLALGAAADRRNRVHLFDARAADQDVGADPRTLALSLGSTQLLKRLGAWPQEQVQTIDEVHVSQESSAATVSIRAVDEGVAFLGAVQTYGRVVAALQARWIQVQAAEADRLSNRFGAAVRSVRNEAGAVHLEADTVELFDLVVVAEGGVFSDQARKGVARDYRQTAWVGTVTLADGTRSGVAYERFTRQGPLALLPLGSGRAAIVWCVAADDDPVAPLDDAQRLTVLNTLLPAGAGGLTSISPLKRFPLGLNAERTLVDGRIVRIGNAAQTLHPVAGQGLNLGLRDAWTLAEGLKRGTDVDAVLRRLERERAPDRWSMIAATDFLARSFTWQLPGAATARGLGLAALNAFGPLKSALARQMMFGAR